MKTFFYTDQNPARGRESKELVNGGHFPQFLDSSGSAVVPTAPVGVPPTEFFSGRIPSPGGSASQWLTIRGHFGKAFTLLELLVVIAIISVLASLLLPALARSKDQGRNTVCVSQLRQLGIATRVYADDNNNFLPTAELLPTSPVNPTNALPRICDVLGPEVGKSNNGTNSSPVFDCPADNEGRFAAEGSSYEWNTDLNGHRIDETTSETLKFVLAWAGPIGGSGPVGGGPGGTNVTVTNGTIQLMFEPSTTPLFTDYDDFHPRSTGSGKNVAFMDDHVTPLQLSDFE